MRGRFGMDIDQTQKKNDIVLTLIKANKPPKGNHSLL